MKILYHNDLDGRCAAFLISHILGKGHMYADKDSFISVSYTRSLPEIEEGEDVYMVDFTHPDTSQMLSLRDKAGTFIWIDHHRDKIFNEALVDIDGLRDEREAGCVLVCKYFGNNVPRFVRQVGLKDLGKLSDSETRYLGAYLESVPNYPTDPIWAKLIECGEDNYLAMLAVGKTTYDARMSQYKFKINTYGRVFGKEDFKTLLVNEKGSSYLGTLAAELGYALTIAYQVNKGGKVECTLYSDKLDTRVFSYLFGGGGHPGASGFTLSLSKFSILLQLLLINKKENQYGDGR